MGALATLTDAAGLWMLKESNWTRRLVCAAAIVLGVHRLL